MSQQNLNLQSDPIQVGIFSPVFASSDNRSLSFKAGFLKHSTAFISNSVGFKHHRTNVKSRKQNSIADLVNLFNVQHA
jgi:hypothetical protein